jgi:hypothetical protein
VRAAKIDVDHIFQIAKPTLLAIISSDQGTAVYTNGALVQILPISSYPIKIFPEILFLALLLFRSIHGFDFITNTLNRIGSSNYACQTDPLGVGETPATVFPEGQLDLEQPGILSRNESLAVKQIIADWNVSNASCSFVLARR